MDIGERLSRPWPLSRARNKLAHGALDASAVRKVLEDLLEHTKPLQTEIETRMQPLPASRRLMVRGLVLLTGLIVEISTRPIALAHMLPPEIFAGCPWDEQAEVLKEAWCLASQAVETIAPGVLSSGTMQSGSPDAGRVLDA